MQQNFCIAFYHRGFCAAWHCSFVEIEIISVMIIALINYLEMTAFVIKRQLSHTFSIFYDDDIFWLTAKYTSQQMFLVTGTDV